MLVEAQRLHPFHKVTATYVPRDQIEAMTSAQKLVVGRHGAAEQIGTAGGIHSLPPTDWVAAFIGFLRISLLEACVAGAGGAVWIKALSQSADQRDVRLQIGGMTRS